MLIRRLPLACALLVVLALPAGASASACENETAREEQRATPLPDCRAYEVVSPAQKNGADVIGRSNRTRAAADGAAVQYTSLTGFGDARGSGLSFDYMALRNGQVGTSGWATHAITPGNLDPLTFLAQFLNTAFDTLYTDEFSDDLSRGLFLSFWPLTGDSPNTASDSLMKIYRRVDLRTAGSGSYQLVSDCPACSSPLSVRPDERSEPGGASADFSHVIFESTLDLTADTAGLDQTVPKLYEWANGTVRLAGILPDGSSAPSSEAGAGVLVRSSAAVNPAHYAPNAISRDGSRIYFTVPSDPTVAETGRLYLRTGNGTPGASTVQVNVAEPTPGASPQDALFEAATPDGSKVFFTTKENLVAADTGDPNQTDLYMYDADALAGHHLTLISSPDPGQSAAVEGLVGASDDGHYVYFVSNQQLLAGQPPAFGAGAQIFVWHDGVIHEVAAVHLTDVPTIALTVTNSWRVFPKASRVSPDGTHLVFRSTNSGGGAADDLPHSGAGDTCPIAGGVGCEEVYSYDATAGGRPVCVSCHTPDGPAQTDAFFAADFGSGVAGNTPHLNRPLSADGRFVFFTTGDRLLAQDLDGLAPDVYEYDTVAGQLHLLSSGRSDSLGSYFLEASASGRDAFFVTRDRLNGWDRDSQMDLYDARVGGGLPEPASESVACAADACHGPQHAGVSLGAPASSTIAGDGNLTAISRPAAPSHKRKACRRGTVRRRVRKKLRCVTRRHHAARRAAGRRGGR